MSCAFSLQFATDSAHGDAPSEGAVIRFERQEHVVAWARYRLRRFQLERGGLLTNAQSPK